MQGLVLPDSATYIYVSNISNRGRRDDFGEEQSHETLILRLFLIMAIAIGSLALFFRGTSECPKPRAPAGAH